MSDDLNAWDVKRPWRTSRLPDCVNQVGAAEILGLHVTGLYRWLKPGSGAKMPWGGFGPDRTYMITPALMNGDGSPFWVREDVERFAVVFGKQRAPKSSAAS